MREGGSRSASKLDECDQMMRRKLDSRREDIVEKQDVGGTVDL